MIDEKMLQKAILLQKMCEITMDESGRQIIGLGQRGEGLHLRAESFRALFPLAQMTELGEGVLFRYRYDAIYDGYPVFCLHDTADLYAR